MGAWTAGNIRDNIFVLNAILNSKQGTSQEDINIQVYDMEQPFDSLWLHKVILSLYQAGLKKDKLPLLSLENINTQVAIKTQEDIRHKTNHHTGLCLGHAVLCCPDGQAGEAGLQQPRPPVHVCIRAPLYIHKWCTIGNHFHFFIFLLPI